MTRTKVVDIELSSVTTIENLEGYGALKGLVRLHGAPLGYIELPIVNGHCAADAIGSAILEKYSADIVRFHLRHQLNAPLQPSNSNLDALFREHANTKENLPLVTVAVCTRDRTRDLALCLDALCHLNYPLLDIIIIDNAPTTSATQELVCQNYPSVRYICEPRPGLDWARNRAILEARGEIIAFTDDDVVVDANWVSALADIFVQSPNVMAVTGLVVPFELETQAQVVFEEYGGFGRGFKRKWFRVHPNNRRQWFYHGSGQFGTGANMAYRRCVFDEIGYFDPALDVGTATNGGGDLEMFFRVLKKGYTLVYEPRALVRHRHRREYSALYTQITNNGIGFYSYLVRSALAYRDERLAILRLGLWWLWWWNLRRLLISLAHPTRVPRDLIQTELVGSLIGLVRYPRARREAKQIIKRFGEQSGKPQSAQVAHSAVNCTSRVGMRKIDLEQPLPAFQDLAKYCKIVVYVSAGRCVLGSVMIANHHHPISAQELADALVEQLGEELLATVQKVEQKSAWTVAIDAAETRYRTPDLLGNTQRAELPLHIPVSIVVATFDRPDSLRRCLHSLVAQATGRDVEIVVVDNHPASGKTPPVIAAFPGVKLVSEPRQGLSYARNAGIAACRGDIVVATDDDVEVQPDWLEKLVAPFARSDVMVVTGNVLPVELRSKAQSLFEMYGGLSRGFKPFQVGADWFYDWFKLHAVPTWELGATANAAFRASIFSDPQIGLFDEALGAGMPTGCSEDTYLFYKVVKAGFKIVYEPSAIVHHHHRRPMSSLRRQIYNYSKGHVAYHLTTWQRDQDWRGLYRIVVELPWGYAARFLAKVKGTTEYPLALLFVEIAGNVVGPLALWRARRRVQRNGASAPFLRTEREQDNLYGENKVGTAQPSISVHSSQMRNEMRAVQ